MKASPGWTLLALVCLLSPLRADYIMGPTEVNTILKTIQKSKQTLNKTDSGAADKQEALFEIGQQGYMLMKLINAEIQSHGDLQQKLIDFAVQRCVQMGVQVQRDPKRQVYLYDFKEFENYVKISPPGRHLPDALFALMEKSYFYTDAGEQNPAILLEQVRKKKEFLKQYPKFARAPELEMFLTLDYYELFAYFSDRQDAKKSAEFKQLAMDQCRRIIETYPNTDAAATAQDILIRLQI